MMVCFLLSLIALKGLKHWRLKRLFEFHSELGFAVKSGFFTYSLQVHMNYFVFVFLFLPLENFYCTLIFFIPSFVATTCNPAILSKINLELCILDSGKLFQIYLNLDFASEFF
jgi:hypothetical protein